MGLSLYLILLGSAKMQRCLLGQLASGHKMELVWNKETNDRPRQ